jgi:hypothetical protein
MTTLDDFNPAAGTRKRKPAKPEWQPLTRDDLAFENVLAIDPSLSATGVVALAHDPVTGLSVKAAYKQAGMIPEGATGWDKNFGQAEDLYDHFEDLYGPLSTRFPEPWRIAIEQPPMVSQRAPESSILVGAMARRVALNTGRQPIMVDPRHHKKVTVGDARLSKVDHHKLLMPWAKTLDITHLTLISNEALRDALSVALTALARLNP